MPIYTKTGDEGFTSLLYGKRLSKGSLEIELLGTLDELNASLGFEVFDKINEVDIQIINIQKSLFEIGAILAFEGKAKASKISQFDELTLNIENNIDHFDEQLPELKNFILPRGCVYSFYLYFSRAICRRAERIFVLYTLNKDNKNSLKPVLKYLNRLSDFLFILGRYANYKNQINEMIWKQS